ncbi:hypothetical protein BCR44DRAFT_1479375 [Catenaria anguillulae PL171]|uniref:Actin-related protein 2/3 complex subunit 3 n=1 Tax=Catenaria anguillulae PL171 TaxID=765915 RepID=A0A1Y2HYA8_9FUNG|nr:hypothetical protein BCR44DRAFT_1479375 [Catenaria anguillulae PL171]
MPVYHSSFNAVTDAPQLGNLALLPLNYFLVSRQLLFRNFEIQGPADRVLIYLILFISECLSKLTVKSSRDEATRALTTLALSQFSIPGEPGFPLNALYAAPASRVDADNMRTYMTQLRQEVVSRLLEKLYAEDASKPSKWWMAFAKRKFMNKSL